ncbi:MAG: spore coat U domain-containing protein [Pseudomonadota bacterium]|uniref:Csu type fimbrial protein n=1 Tax=Sphingomonas sp. ERG5 TaxID=1381597 RepID=UPI001269D8B1|nr:spore coat U domain-containing protein [Sphingomonas sp. ERG5]
MPIPIMKLLRGLVGMLGAASFAGNMLATALIALPALVVATPAHAACTNTSGATQNRTFTYTAATLGTNAKLDFPSTITCLGILSDGLSFCMGAMYTPTVLSGASSMALRLDFVDTTHGQSVTGMSTTGTMYGPYGPGGVGISTTVATLSAVVPAPAATSVPAGTYTRAFQIYMDMASGSTCDAYATNLVDFAYGNYTANFVVPKVCSLISSPAISFGPVSSIGPTAARIDAQGSVTVQCNDAYTIYIGDGNNRVAAGSGNRQMANGAARLPYQLYKDPARSQIWDATGGTATTGGSGGLSDTGLGANQTKTVYAAIPIATTLPTLNGAYSDTVVITVTY